MRAKRVDQGETRAARLEVKARTLDNEIEHRATFDAVRQDRSVLFGTVIHIYARIGSKELNA
jgi:hypothetical protein